MWKLFQMFCPRVYVQTLWLAKPGTSSERAEITSYTKSPLCSGVSLPEYIQLIRYSIDPFVFCTALYQVTSTLEQKFNVQPLEIKTAESLQTCFVWNSVCKRQSWVKRNRSSIKYTKKLDVCSNHVQPSRICITIFNFTCYTFSCSNLPHYSVGMDHWRGTSHLRVNYSNA